MSKIVQMEDKILVNDVREEWRQLWRYRIDDKVKAEAMASRDFRLLFVERGTVILASRDFKPLDLKQILSLHDLENVERLIPPSPSIGGWGKFARAVLAKQKRAQKWKESAPKKVRSKSSLQVKKGGRGWLHFSMKK